MATSRRLHPRKAVLFAVIAVLFAAAAWQWRPSPQQQRVDRVYFLDEGDDTLFVADATALPPIEAPSGVNGVRAYVFSCSTCADASSRQIGFVTRYTDELKRAMANATINASLEARGTLVRRPGQTQWYAMSDDGAAIVQQVFSACPQGGRQRECLP